jgi:hypothetical protein
MNARISQSLIPLLGLLAVAIPPVFADEEGEDETTKRISHLIGMLASRNAPPKIVGDPCKGEEAEIHFDKTYDKNLQVPVYLAMQQLLAEGEDAFDQLLKHGDDKRYCLSVNSLNDKNITVGEVCQRIFGANIRPWSGEIRFLTKGGGGRTPGAEGKSFKEWWKEKKRIGLAKVQIEVIDADLDFMRKADAKKAVAWHPYAKPVPPAEFESRREANIRVLTAIRESIVRTGKPYRARTIEGSHEYIFGLPWTGRKHNL